MPNRLLEKELRDRANAETCARIERDASDLARLARIRADERLVLVVEALHSYRRSCGINGEACGTCALLDETMALLQPAKEGHNDG